ncbi:hypothetical protein GCM10023205_53350 [Yinghuangia aomiensis]|uniref:Transcriptional regulator, IclR family n=1 Tax=Yinghuangia aomiensis TaxID=676205 RepID=A0ABP9HUE7_9ACTN
MGSADSGIRVVRKAGALLDVLAQRGPLSVAQLADATGEPRTTVYRLLASLRQLGWVTDGPRRGSYALDIGLLPLGRAAAGQSRTRACALPVMRALREETGLTVYLTVPRGTRAVCVERIDGRTLQNFGLLLGGTLPLHAGAGPRVLLAFGDTELRGRWRRSVEQRGEARSLTALTPVSTRDIEDLLQKVVLNGYAVSTEDNVPGLAAIGAPIFDADHGCLAALSISGRRDDLLHPDRRHAFVTAVVRSAQRISERVGNKSIP